MFWTFLSFSSKKAKNKEQDEDEEEVESNKKYLQKINEKKKIQMLHVYLFCV